MIANVEANKPLLSSEIEMRETIAGFDAASPTTTVADSLFSNSEAITTKVVIPQVAVAEHMQKVTSHDNATQAEAVLSNSLISAETVAVACVQERTEPLVETQQANVVVTSSVQTIALGTETAENVELFDAVKQPEITVDTHIEPNEIVVVSEVASIGVVQPLKDRVTTVDTAKSAIPSVTSQLSTAEISTYRSVEDKENLEYSIDQAKVEAIVSELQQVRIVGRPQTGNKFKSDY